ncbi:hypothetical protein DAKH74_045190 [Maudiozyma humilis]|uniref:PA14 domain-containing protein n=1 Tax=Maudiozyma humilis TaxID=51915 RepID=A0AAV5S2G0_MAUHU|nr:hypothetical protein DAKH74_045190 [Kazachstania humilis]
MLIHTLLTSLTLALVASPVLGQGVNLDSDVTHSCKVPEGSQFTEGFRARFFPYLHPQYTYEYDNREYLLSLYSTLNAPTHTTYGIYDVNFLYQDWNAYNGPQWGEFQGYTTTLTNFTIEYMGYFIPQTTGKYTFSFEGTDDSALLFFANPSAFRCCNSDANIDTNEEDVSIDAIDQWATGAPSTVTVTLEEGLAYPMRIVYYNQGGIGKLYMTWTDPQGVRHDTFDKYVTYFSDVEQVCDHEVVATTTSFEVGTATYTTTQSTIVTTYTGTDDVITTETIYVVQTPGTPATATTAIATTVFTTGDLNLKETTTYSTATGIYTGSDGIVTSETTFYVEEPQSHFSSLEAIPTQENIQAVVPTIAVTMPTFVITTVYDSDIVEPTSTTEVTTFLSTNDEGDEEEVIETEIVVEEPEPETTEYTAETTTEFTNVPEPTTKTQVTTYFTTDDEGDEEEVIETDVIVEEPEPSTTEYTAQTTTEFTNVPEPTTETHVTTYFTTDEEGEEEEVIETEVVVEVPEPETTEFTAETTTEFTDVPEPTTETHVTTYFTTDDNGDEEEVIETEVVVELPEPDTTQYIAETTTEFGDVTAPTTETQLTTYYTTDENGNEEEVVETEVIVEIPSAEETITSATTSFTVGDVTETTTLSTFLTTFYTTDSEGNVEEVIDTEYIVEIPDVEETVTTATTEYTNYPGSVTTTLTQLTTFMTTDAEGNLEEVVETEIIVEIPENRDTAVDAEEFTPNTVSQEEEISTAETFYTHYTGSVTSTYSTHIRTYTTTDSNGNEEEVIETDFYVEIPESTVTIAPPTVQVVSQETKQPSENTIQTSELATSTTNLLSEYQGSATLVTGRIATFIVGLISAMLLI